MTRSTSGSLPGTAPSAALHAAHPAPQAPLSSATASSAPADTTGFRSSGQSPGGQSPATQSPATQSPGTQSPEGKPQALPTLHLVGPGQVGRAFLQQCADLPVRVVAASDSTATVFDRQGLALDVILAHKAGGGALRTLYRAEPIPTELAIAVVAADYVVDATPTSVAGTETALQRARAALRSGAFLALCGKNALAAAAPELLLGPHRGRVGIQAVLGGAGRQLVRELDELREHCRELCLVGNVTTTVIVQAIEQGASVEQGIELARQRGLLEPDPSLDLDGSDAATKLAAVWGAVFGESWLAPLALPQIRRQDLRGLDAAVLRERARRGATTRLVARGSRGGRDLRVGYEEVPLGSPLAAPPDRVVYGYELPSGLRVHTGLAVGYARTAAALGEDVTAALRAAEVVR